MKIVVAGPGVGRRPAVSQAGVTRKKERKLEESWKVISRTPQAGKGHSAYAQNVA